MAERELWAGVMALAWQDATGEVVSSGSEPPWLLKAQARRWFESGEGTLATCCQALGLDVAAVQGRYRAAIAAQSAAEAQQAAGAGVGGVRHRRARNGAVAGATARGRAQA